jgi:hypothetical protein
MIIEKIVQIKQGDNVVRNMTDTTEISLMLDLTSEQIEKYDILAYSEYDCVEENQHTIEQSGVSFFLVPKGFLNVLGTSGSEGLFFDEEISLDETFELLGVEDPGWSGREAMHGILNSYLIEYKDNKDYLANNGTNDDDLVLVATFDEPILLDVLGKNTFEDLMGIADIEKRENFNLFMSDNVIKAIEEDRIQYKCLDFCTAWDN